MKHGHDLLVPAADLPEVAPQALADAARRANLDDADAQLMRLFSTAVYHLPAADAVARIAMVTSPQSVTRLDTSVRVTRWLGTSGFPAVEPLPVDQPVLSHGCAVTFWRYLPQHGPAPRPADLGYLLRQLHSLGPPPFPLPAYRPLVIGPPGDRSQPGDQRRGTSLADRHLRTAPARNTTSSTSSCPRE